MVWLKIDDQQQMNPKYRAMGLYARAVYNESLRWCASQETDGRIPSHMIPVIAALAEIPADETHNAVQRLVGLGAFEDNPVEPGWVIHDWLVYQPSRASLLAKRKRDRRKKELHSKAMEPVREAARARDGDVCRYCGCDVVFSGPGSRTGPNAGTFDHVDPAGSNDLDNVVVACHPCNSRKKDRTPGDVGMVLRPVPGATLPAPAAAPAPRPARRRPPARTSPPSKPASKPRPSSTAPAKAAPSRRAAPRGATGPPR